MGNVLPSSRRGGEQHDQVSGLRAVVATKFLLEDLPEDLVWMVLAAVRESDSITWINLRACCKSFCNHISPQVQRLQLFASSATDLWLASDSLRPALTFPASTDLHIASDAPRELLGNLLAAMPKATWLDVQHSRDSTSFWYLAQDLKALLPLCSSLTGLSLPLHCSLESFEQLRSLTRLTSLGLCVNGRCHGHHIRNQHLEALTELTALTSLRLLDVTCAAGHRMLPMLGMLSNLQVLDLVDAKIDDFAIMLMARLRCLRSLAIKAVKLAPLSGLTGNSVGQLRSLSCLECVQLHVRDSQKPRGVTPITLDLLCALGDLPRLSSLSLCGFAFPSSASSAQSPSRFSSLTDLAISSAGYIIPGSLEVLGLHKPLPRLQQLRLNHCHLHDPPAITHLAAFHPNLRALSLGAAAHAKLVSKATLLPLLELAHLEMLTLGVLEGGVQGQLLCWMEGDPWFAQLLQQVGQVHVVQGHTVATSCSRSCCNHPSV